MTHQTRNTSERLGSGIDFKDSSAKDNISTKADTFIRDIRLTRPERHKNFKNTFSYRLETLKLIKKDFSENKV